MGSNLYISQSCRLYAVITCCMMFTTSCLAALLSDAEKQLLNTSMSTDQAAEYGRHWDADGLAKIISLGDPAMVTIFADNMRFYQLHVHVLPAKIEALVIANFDNSKVGAALKNFPYRYQTRTLFDLHYARIKAAFRNNDPSFAQILNTDQIGIEQPLLEILDKFEIAPAQRYSLDGKPVKVYRPTNRLLEYLCARKMPEIVPKVLAELENVDQGNLTEFHCLLNYPSVDIWEKTRNEIEKLHQSGKILEANYIIVSKELNAHLSDPTPFLTKIKNHDNFIAYNRQLNKSPPDLRRLFALKQSNPQQYYTEYRRYLEHRYKLASAYSSEVDGTLGIDYYRLATMVRFLLMRPSEAVELYAKAEEHGEWWAKIAEADTYQFDLHDNNKALERYQYTLDRILKPALRRPSEYYPFAGKKDTVWLTEWLQHEIQYIKTGKAFSGNVSEAALGGFLIMMHSHNYAEVLNVLEQRPDVSGTLPYACTGTTSDSQALHCFGPNSSWSELASELAKANRVELAALLNKLPASHLTLLATIHPLTVLPDSDSILSYLNKHDPSGYWSTCLLGTVHYLNQQPGNDALRSQLIPGGSKNAKLQPISLAAKRYMSARGMHLVPVVSDKELRKFP